MKIIVIASGSKGNATYIEYLNTKILIDAGIALKTLKERLLLHNIELTLLDAILVTHEHSDHIKNLSVISNNTNAFIYITEKSFNNISHSILKKIDIDKVNFIKKEKIYTIKDISFVPIKLSHDTKECIGFLIKMKNTSIGIITDTGVIIPKYYDLLKQMNYLIIESNHDVRMLLESDRDYTLKRRILSNKGHLSNDECANILKDVVNTNTKKIVLAHLSEECNTEELALNTASNVLKTLNFNTTLLCATQNHPCVVEDIDD